MLTADQLIAAQKATMDTMFSLGKKSFEGVEKLVELNLQMAKTAMEEVAEHAKATLSAKDPQEFMALQSGLMQPTAEKITAYARHVYDITSAAGSEVTKMTESEIAESQKKFMAMVDSAVKNAPAGSENVVVLMKSAVTAANNAFETAQKAAKQAANVAEANMQAVANTATKTVKTATRRTA